MTLEEFEEALVSLIGKPSRLRPFVCNGSPLDCDILLVGFNPKTPLPGDYWSFWRKGFGFDKRAFEQAYTAKRRADGESEASTTREVTRRLAIGAAGCKIVEANLFAKDSKDERALAKSDRDDRPFRFLLATLQPKVVVPFGRYARQGLAHMSANFEIRPVQHFSRGWGYDAAEAFGAELAAICRRASGQRHADATQITVSNHPPKLAAARAKVERRDTVSDTTIALDEFCKSEANLLVRRRMHEIEAVSGLKIRGNKKQASLFGGPEYQGTVRPFRHEFSKEEPEVLLREDLFSFEPGLKLAADWKDHTSNRVFRKLRTDDLSLLGRILDAVAAYAAERAP